MLGVAALTGAAARRLGQPSIVGYLLAGVVVGPYIPIPLFADPERVHSLAEFGVVLVMFAVGLEFRFARLLQILPKAGLTTTFQVGAIAWLGYTVGGLVGFVALFTVLLWPILSLGFLLAQAQETASACDRIRELLDAPMTVTDRPGVVPLPVGTPARLRFEHVAFRFPGAGEPVLTDVDLDIAGGDHDVARFVVEP